MMDLQWEKWGYSLLLVLIPLMGFLFWQLIRWQKKTRQQFADSHLLPHLFSSVNYKGYWTGVVAFLLALFFIILALMNPLWGEERQKLKREGIDMVFAIDLSASMDAEDVAPSRLEKSKNFVYQALNNFGGDRVGLVIFAGDGYVISPLTNDYAAIESYLQGMSTHLISNQGTNTADAIHKSLELLGDSPDTSKAIILISDGEDHEEGLDEVLKQINENKVEVFAYGVGNTTPVPIPIYENGYQYGYKKDKAGKTVMTQFTGQNLKAIAQKTQGSYHKIENTKNTVQVLMSDLSTLQKKSQSETITMSMKHRFQWPLAISVFLIFIFTLTPIGRFLNT